MGLLSRISAGIDTAPVVPAEDSISFFDFIQNNPLSHVCIFSKVNSFFVASASWGFDGDTILKSLSTSDFWEGSVKQGTWNVFSRDDNNLNTILQFFSDSFKNVINFVQVYAEENRILLIANENKPLEDTILSKIASDFKKTNENLKIKNREIQMASDHSIKFSIKAAAEGLMQQLNESIRSFIENSLITETCCSLTRLLEEPDYFTVSDDYKFSVEIFSKSNITSETLKTFLTFSLKTLFKDKSSLIAYEY